MKNHYISRGIAIYLCTVSMCGCSAVGAKITDFDNTDSAYSADSASEETAVPEKTATPVPVCDGTTVTTACEVDGIMYSTYIYHPAVPEQSHIESQTVTEQVQTGTCTLCNDGTMSPSCAVGRGACSHHNGVAQYGAPVYGNETHTIENKVVDAPAADAYYETVPQQ
jgi:hypothetical protein